MKHEPAQTGFKIHNLLKRDLVLIPVYVKAEQLAAVSQIVDRICKRFLEHFFLNRFGYKAIGQSLKNLIYIFFVVCDIDNESVGILFADRSCGLDP